MINPSQIEQKAQRKYPEFLQAVLKEQNFFPLELPVGKIPSDYIQLRDEINQLLNKSKSDIGYGYTVELITKNTRKYGNQTLPNRITIDTEADYLKLINKQSEFIKFKVNVKLIRSAIPQLEQWLCSNTQQVIKYADKWEDLLKVCDYFQNNPFPNLYIRELPIEVHTKFIEQNKSIITSLLEAVLLPEYIQSSNKNNKRIFEQKFSLRYDEPLVRLRILDKQVPEKYNFPVSDLTTPLSEFKTINLKKYSCFITENKMNFLTLPYLKNSFAIWGGGYKSLVLKSVNWLSDCPIFYWGDLDADGFKILAQLRGYFPQTVSVMMNRDTFDTFKNFAVNVPQSKLEKLPNLTSEEYNLYSYISNYGKRLEQEHISQNYAIEHLIDVLEYTNS